MGDVDRIPVFPLNTVLFPGMGLSLHIFEDRYKQMVKDRGIVDGSFGVTLIREGDEVGGVATPYVVGTVARIVQAISLPEGEFFLQIRGTQRFRLRRLIYARPYLEGEVEYLSLASVDSWRLKHVALEAIEEFQRYLDALRLMGGRVADTSGISHDPELISWLVASNLIIKPAMRQELLEMDDTVLRLQREMELLAECTRVLRARAERRGSSSRLLPFSLN